MAPKRKSDVLDTLDAVETSSLKENKPEVELAPIFKKARASDASEAESSSKPVKAKAKGKKAAETAAPTRWQDVVLEGEDEDGGVPVYDDCNDIRRKIRALQKTPGFKVTHWLQEIGKVNSNSFGRFMKASGPTGGASNGTYYCAYKYFENVRIAEGKKKTPKRISQEATHHGGMELQERRYVWGPA
ncbi:hypothetical protein HGRIS_007747 [Hohenbuehelia grisea]|uniref:DUF7726 domain-containing protein n=1 Tax=Hohenbuehelia grisea TaxID=104357 RepID=A0ABR3J5S9_9AGAR